MIGLIGGLSYHSTLFYYDGINRLVAEHFGGFNSAEMLLYNFNFEQIIGWQHRKEFDQITKTFEMQGTRLSDLGCHKVLICSNTMHAFSNSLEQKIGIKLLHIADTVAAYAKAHKLERPLLLGTSFTMERGFYIQRLKQQGLEAEVPDANDRRSVHDIIYRHLVHGDVKQDFIEFGKTLAARYRQLGCDSLILGCTELRMIFPLPLQELHLIDSTQTHIDAAFASIVSFRQ